MDHATGLPSSAIVHLGVAALRWGCRPPHRGRAVWGDGFADDTFSDVAAVRSWDLCSPDEYIRFFPKLVGREEALPAGLIEHLRECLAVRVWRLHRLQRENRCVDLASLRSEDVERIGRQHEDAWFPTARREGRWFFRSRTSVDGASEAASDLAFIVFLDGVTQAVAAGRLPDFDRERALDFAYHTGVHPAYVWPEAALAASRNVTAGWLGYIGRGRAAMMLQEVAEYLHDLIDPRCGGPALVRDPQMGRFIPTQHHAAALWTGVKATLAGEPALVRWGRA